MPTSKSMMPFSPVRNWFEDETGFKGVVGERMSKPDLVPSLHVGTLREKIVRVTNGGPGVVFIKNQGALWQCVGMCGCMEMCVCV